jgi:hypothetical protein
MLRSGFVAILIIAAPGAPCCGQLPQIRLDHVFPLGAEAGSTFQLEISGKDLDDVTELRFEHPGLKATRTKPNEFRVTVDADTPRGTHEFRAIGKHGLSGSRLISIDRGLSEIKKEGQPDSPATAQAVAPNAAINGRTKANSVDHYRLSLLKHQRVIVECRALRLDSTMRGILSLSIANGKELIRGAPGHDRVDPVINFVAPDAGDYQLALHDLMFGGELPYRLIVSDHPSIEVVFPPVMEPGTTRELEVLGRNLPGGTPTSVAIPGGPPLERSAIKVAFPVPGSGLGRPGIRDIVHLPSAANLTRGAQLWPPDWPFALAPFTILEITGPLLVEHEPNDARESAQAITPAVTICGRFDRPGDVDVYRFKAQRGQTLAVDVVCDRMQKPGDSLVIVHDSKGTELAVLDDQASNLGALTQLNRDPGGLVTAREDGEYFITVLERSGRGGPRHLYVLRLGPPEPDFAPVICHENNDPTSALVRQGGSALYEVAANRRGGFNGTVMVEAQGLPKGVACPPIAIGPRAEQAPLVLHAQPDAPEWSGMIRLVAWADIDGRRVERLAAYAQRRWGETVNGQPNLNNASRTCREIGLAVRPKGPYSLSLTSGPTGTAVAVGTRLTAKVSASRFWPEFQGAISLTGLLLPPGFELAPAEVAAGATEITARFTVAADVPPGRYTLALRGEAQVPFSTDPAIAASDKPLVRVTSPSTPLIVTVTAPAPK